MKLSSLDIRKQEFTRVVRGYDKEEVDAFLQLAANQWQEIVDDLRREEEKVNELNIKLEHYQKVEEALEEALKTARDGAKQTIANAERKAQLIIESAEERSVSITRDAESERLDIRKDAAKYSVRQKEIVAKLRAFLMSELEILAQYESEAPVNYIKLKAADIAEIMSGKEEAAPPAKQVEPSYESDAHGADEDYYEEEDGNDGYYDDEPVDDLGDEHYEEEPVASSPAPESARKPLSRKAESESKVPDRSQGRSEKSTVEEPEVSDEIEKIRRILEDLEK